MIICREICRWRFGEKFVDDDLERNLNNDFERNFVMMIWREIFDDNWSDI